MNKPVDYSTYLQLDRILSSQFLKSEEHKKPAHDEMLFIIIHQIYELWFKQILFELDAVLTTFNQQNIPESEIGIGCARLERIVEIQKILIDQIKVLETMTPLDFLEFRDYLTPASGFQSYQFRLLEIKLGLPTASRLQYNNSAYTSRLSAQQAEQTHNAENQPTLLQLFDRWLSRTPFLKSSDFEFFNAYKNSVVNMLNKDRQNIQSNQALSEDARKMEIRKLEMVEKASQNFFDPQLWQSLVEKGEKRLSHQAMQAALFICSYREMPILQMPFRLLTLLMEIDENLTTWRYRHSQMVQRMIGIKIGTGGSSGHEYLRAAVDKHKVFTDLFELSTLFIPRSQLPEIPLTLKSKMGFFS